MRPSRGERWFLHASSFLVGGTGLVYAWMRYLAVAEDPYAVVNHAWQPGTQHLHVLVAPLLVFGFGLLWAAHIRRGLRSRGRIGWVSGVGAALLGLPMAASGYLLQVTVEEAWRTAWIVVHLVTSGLWLVAYVAHLPVFRRRGRS